ncbi:unnamed protein product [Cuscuta campestris]|uniref:No apical meristem-associated C-terminal domain-containing protein n=1 Tax=Cuscuta campestris TaxID=132261 RepID=A0A484MU98_9ASTE|nr:unnamed protein product [Cuscuta campestris]
MNPSGSGFFPDNLPSSDAAMWLYQQWGDRPPIYETQQSGYVDRDSVLETQLEPSGSKKSTRRKSHKAKSTLTEAAQSIQKWTPEECILASAWVDISEHPIIVYQGMLSVRRSGTNDTDVLRLTTARYQDDGHQGKVPIDLWRILSRFPKWQQLNNPGGGSFRKRSTVNAEVEVDNY